MDARVSIVSPRLDGKPWGGRELERFGMVLPEGRSIGEALVTAGDAKVAAGFGVGQGLDHIVASDPDALLGPSAKAAVGGRSVFPLLVKLIDANENLSLQVHPNDAQAHTLDRLGKTEAWHVLAAEPGSFLYLGLQPGVTLNAFAAAAARLDGSSARLMRAVPAQAGATVLIPAGTIHALGAGVMVYEVQQPSNVTYRLDDWGRLDAHGNPREMHKEAGLNVARPELAPEPIEPVSLRPAIGERHLLAACRYFALERVALPAGAVLEVGRETSPTVVTVLEGEAATAGLTLGSGTSAIVWPTSTVARFLGRRPFVALVATVPELEADVVQRAARAGANGWTIAALGGGTGDLIPATPS